MDQRDAIPNNVGLAGQPRLRRVLEQFRADYLGWWRDAGPQGFDAADVYLRMPTGVDARGWANYRYVKLPDYRWGIYQAEPVAQKPAVFGRPAGTSLLGAVPAEFRETMIKLLVTQGDTEPASVEQSRLLGHGIPSLYDLRNLFQINCEEGRHLWAMVHLLVEHFGRDGEREIEGLLERRSGSTEKPRILNAFNAPIDEWLSFLFWSTLADRDGKYQLLALSESAFDPLARTTKFMLTEEAHHMFVGDDGLRRVVQRTAELMLEHDTDDVASHGGINLATIQRYLNYWAPQTIDLFGNELSDWSEALFDAGLKGRPYESERYDEHVGLDAPISVERSVGGRLAGDSVPMRKALNEVMRETYLGEIGAVIERWNRLLAKANIAFTFRVPDKRFNRRIGVYRDFHFAPDGTPLSAERFAAGLADWLPSAAERAHVKSLMQPVYEPGKIAGWIAPPQRGIDGKKPLDFEYVRL